MHSAVHQQIVLFAVALHIYNVGVISPAGCGDAPPQFDGDLRLVNHFANQIAKACNQRFFINFIGFEIRHRKARSVFQLRRGIAVLIAQLCEERIQVRNLAAQLFQRCFLRSGEILNADDFDLRMIAALRNDLFNDRFIHAELAVVRHAQQHGHAFAATFCIITNLLILLQGFSRKEPVKAGIRNQLFDHGGRFVYAADDHLLGIYLQLRADFRFTGRTDLQPVDIRLDRADDEGIGLYRVAKLYILRQKHAQLPHALPQNFRIEHIKRARVRLNQALFRIHPFFFPPAISSSFRRSIFPFFVSGISSTRRRTPGIMNSGMRSFMAAYSASFSIAPM